MAGYGKVNLKSDQFLLQVSSTISANDYKYYEDLDKIKINNKNNLFNSKNIQTENFGESIYNYYTDVIIIIPDNISEGLLVAREAYVANTIEELPYKNISQINSYIEDEGLEASFNQKFNENHFTLDTKTESLNNGMIGALLIKMIGRYAGIIFLTMFLTILSISQLNMSLTQKYNFDILKKIGLNNIDIKNIIVKQLFIFFIIPFIIGSLLLLLLLYIYISSNNNSISAFVGINNLTKNIFVTLLSIFIIYILYFFITYKVFLNNVKVK